ncbi:sigma-70 family RNA polymerase sigma factor [Janthinobacterium sp. 1_2014MBL_MicDiv]|uniref:sigma-70 family RNA polymerase sigma factor n=1 Tax=Janthinobacterium sp. 1_2014MBL_MicDiv TaxID=1644131 RepID=UPI0008F4ADB2|nr:sigma-70 family RNA polymerase sigma factor [Janthinobacterium sp. 1_2014MBL_MicDiv]APA68294.1 RNA polymerase sigma factor [Janthinobacterium sp. 1_2014MBL_MicDiv]
MLRPELELHRQIEVLYSDHHGWLQGWLRRKLGNAFDAADLAHDTYLRILARGRAPAPVESRQHLAQIANGLVVDLFRRRHIEAAYADAIAAQPEAAAPTPETRALIVEALMEIDAILASLPQKVRDAFLLCKLEGLAYADIAARLDVSVSSVEKYIARALLACCAAQFT